MNVQNKLALGYIRTKLNILSAISEKMAGEELFRLFCTPLTNTKNDSAGAFSGHEQLSFSLNGNTIRGYRCNFPAKKTALILHGFSSCVHNFSDYVEPLISKGYAVLAFDAPAHGRSGGKTVNAVQYAEMVRYIMNEYGPVDALIGHSFGGLATALALEGDESERRVVLIAPATETTTAIEGALKLMSLNNPRFRNALDRKIEAFSGKTAAWFSIRRAMANIRARVLWLHDETDRITPLDDVLRVKREDHPHVTYHFTNGLGHRRIYRDPAVRKQILEFLA